MPGSVILGLGAHRPPRVITNEELAGELAVTADALFAASGVRERPRAEVGQGPSHLACAAAREALAMADAEPTDVDCIIFATISPDIAFPGPGCFLQDQLGCNTVGALDIRAQDAGFVYALATGDRFVRAGKARRVLVCGGDVHSSALDYSARAVATTPIFGDGAGVALLGDADEAGVLATVLHSDATGYQRFWCESPGSRTYPARMTRRHFDEGRHFYSLDASAIAEQAETTLAATTDEVLRAANVATDAVSLFVMHYLDPRVAGRAAERAGLPAERVIATAERGGHVAAGGIPIALTEALQSGRVQRGDVVCCVAFGGGMAWGGALLRL